jgi:hypothetical protein
MEDFAILTVCEITAVSGEVAEEDFLVRFDLLLFCILELGDPGLLLGTAQKPAGFAEE